MLASLFLGEAKNSTICLVSIMNLDVVVDVVAEPAAKTCD